MISEIVKTYLNPSDNFIFGFANLKGLLIKEFEAYSYGISIARVLDNRIVDAIKNGPTQEYIDHCHEVNIELHNIATTIAVDLLVNKVNSIAVVPTISTSSEEFSPYLNALTYKVSHKMIATRAGLGWIGKTDLFISRDFGARVRLVSILINKRPDIINEPIEASKCGKCNTCVTRCPAKAANGKLWDIYTSRDVFYNAQKCREKCGELCKAMLNKDVYVCGICVSECPIGKAQRK